MPRPVIIAICGKSASGKDTLARALARLIGSRSHMIVSTTSRPPRRNEVDGIDYHFIDKDSNRLTKQARDNTKDYLEWCYFRGWFYGTKKEEILLDKINIGVFNPAGIKSLLQYQYDYDIYIILCQEYFPTRVKRSIKRDGFSLEIFRRLIVDYFDFESILSLLGECRHPFLPYGSVCLFKNPVDVVEYYRNETNILG